MKESGYRCLTCLAVVIVILAVVSPTIGQGKKGRKITDLTMTLVDTPDYRVWSDGNGTYPAVFGNQYFQLDLDSNRSLVLDFGDCEEGSGCPGPFAGGPIAVSGTEYPVLNALSQIEDLVVGSPISPRFRIRFKDPQGDEWVLRYFGETETCGTNTPRVWSSPRATARRSGPSKLPRGLWAACSKSLQGDAKPSLPAAATACRSS